MVTLPTMFYTWYNGRQISAIHLICNCGSSCCLSRSISAWGWSFSSNLSLSPCSMNSSVTNLAARFCTCHCFVDAAKSDDVINIAISKYRCESSSQLYSLDSTNRKNLFLNLIDNKIYHKCYHVQNIKINQGVVHWFNYDTIKAYREK